MVGYNDSVMCTCILDGGVCLSYQSITVIYVCEVITTHHTHCYPSQSSIYSVVFVPVLIFFISWQASINIMQNTKHGVVITIFYMAGSTEGQTITWQYTRVVKYSAFKSSHIKSHEVFHCEHKFSICLHTGTIETTKESFIWIQLS